MASNKKGYDRHGVKPASGVVKHVPGATATGYPPDEKSSEKESVETVSAVGNPHLGSDANGDRPVRRLPKPKLSVRSVQMPGRHHYVTVAEKDGGPRVGETDPEHNG